MEPTQFQYTYTSTFAGRGGFTIYIANNVGYPVIQLYYNLETEEEALEQARTRMTTTGYYDSRNNLNYEPEGTPIPEGFFGEQNVEITGRVSSKETKGALEGVKVKYLNNRAETDSRGFFKLDFTFRPGDSIETIKFNKRGFAEELRAVADRNNIFKSDLGVIEMEPNERNPIKLQQQVIIDATTGVAEQLKHLNPADAKAALLDRINRAKQELWSILVPKIVLLLQQFGIKVVKNAIASEAQSCPPFRDINEMVQQRNRYTRQINKLYNTINSVNRAITGINSIVQAIRAVFQVLKFLPLPTSIPPGIGIPMSLVQNIDDKKDKLEEKLDAFAGITTNIIAILSLFGGALQRVLALLQGLDAAIGSCIDEARQTVADTLALQSQFNSGSLSTGSANIGIGVGTNGQDYRGGLDESSLDNEVDYRNIPNLNDILGVDSLSNDELADLLAGNYFQEQLNSDLVELSNLLAEEGGRESDGGLGREVNGFILDVQTDPKYEVGKLNRRFAVGKNQDGIVLIQGDPSFASSDEILIEELAFFIEQNDLKPN